MKKFFLLMAIFAQLSLAANAEISVSPLTVELEATNRTKFLTTCFSAQAGKKDTIRYKVYPAFFNIDEKGTISLLEKADAPNCLIKRSRYLPSEFTLTNGKPQKIRVTLTDLSSLPDGESRMILFLEDVAIKEINLPTQNNKIKAKLLVKTRIGVPIYVDKGKVVKVATFDDLKVEQNKKDLVYNIKLNSTGNSRIRAKGKCQILRNSELISEFPTDNLLLSSASDFFRSGKIPTDKLTQPGDYILRMTVNYPDQNGRMKKMIKEASFTINETQTAPSTPNNTIEQKQTNAVKLPSQ